MSQFQEMNSARRLLIAKCMKALREYSRTATVYLSFVGFVVTEVALIVFVYRYLGIM